MSESFSSPQYVSLYTEPAETCASINFGRPAYLVAFPSFPCHHIQDMTIPILSSSEGRKEEEDLSATALSRLHAGHEACRLYWWVRPHMCALSKTSHTAPPHHLTLSLLPSPSLPSLPYLPSPATPRCCCRAHWRHSSSINGAHPYAAWTVAHPYPYPAAPHTASYLPTTCTHAITCPLPAYVLNKT